MYVYRNHHTVQVTILHPITTTTTTAQAAMHACNICATALGKKTTTSVIYCAPGPAQAPFRGSEAASPLLACTMQQAHVRLHIRACHWIRDMGNSMACPYASYMCLLHRAWEIPCVKLVHSTDSCQTLADVIDSAQQVLGRSCGFSVATCQGLWYSSHLRQWWDQGGERWLTSWQNIA